MPDLEEDFDDAMFESLEANPALAEAAARMTSQTEMPEVEEPLDGPVTLPGGFYRMNVSEEHGTTREEVRKAWVRELNGEDEERIAKAKGRDDLAAFVDAILECGVERLGDRTPTRDDLEDLTLGDRDYLLLEIARATYGDELEYANFPCHNCGEPMDFTVHLGEDIPVTRLESVAETSFDVRLSKDRVARVNLPSGSAGAKVALAETGAEANTQLIASCVDYIRGPSGEQVIGGDEGAAKRLSVRDRAALVDAMGERMPGPRYNEVSFTHGDGEDGTCGKEVRLTVTLADLFRTM